jgi:hypothetical protein
MVDGHKFRLYLHHLRHPHGEQFLFLHLSQERRGGVARREFLRLVGVNAIKLGADVISEPNDLAILS